jgi:predicted lipoprotein
MRKPIRYSLGLLTVFLILFLSLKVKKLDEYKSVNPILQFSSKEYAGDFWINKLPEVINYAPEFLILADLLNSDSEKAFGEYGRKPGISGTWYFMVRGNGVIEKVEEENLLVKINDTIQTRIATSFIFGNAVRDGSGVVDIDEFLNMTDFNNVSIEINNLVKSNVVPALNEDAKPGMNLEFAGAFEIREDSIDVHNIRIIPVSVNFNNGTTE